MPAVRTLAQLRLGPRRLTDTLYDPNVDDADLDEFINDALREVWSYKFEWNPDVFLLREQIDAVAGTQAYEVPDDFGSLRRVDWVDGQTRVVLTEAPPLLEADLSQPGNWSGGAPQYRLIGGGIDGSTTRLYLLPDPGTYTYELWYVQAPQRLEADDDELDITHGEDRYVQAAVAARICERQDRDATPHRAEQGRALECLKSLVRRRDSGRSKRITDVRSLAATGRERLPRP